MNCPNCGSAYCRYWNPDRCWYAFSCRRNPDEVNIPESELKFSFARSSGPGGQHVQKTSTKVQLKWNITDSRAFDDDQKQKIIDFLPTRHKKWEETPIGKKCFIKMSSSETRSQKENIERVKNRLFGQIKKALEPKKVRKKRKPSAAAKAARRKLKEQIKTKKERRRKDWD
jgi:ribosome-associated protein